MVKAAAAVAVVLAISPESVRMCVPRFPLLAEIGSQQVYSPHQGWERKGIGNGKSLSKSEAVGVLISILPTRLSQSDGVSPTVPVWLSVAPSHQSNLVFYFRKKNYKSGI